MHKTSRILDDDEPAVARLSAFGSLDSDELAGLSEIAGAERYLARGETLWQEGTRLPGLFLLTDGWMAAARGSDDARRILKIYLPGDLLGLPSLAFKMAGESVVALTFVKLRPLRLHSFGALFEAHPRIAAMLLMVSQQERMELSDRLFGARGSPVTRIAAALILLARRIERSFPGGGDNFHLPLTKADMAHLIGLSDGQLQSGLKSLRESGLIGWSRQRFTIIDRTSLEITAALPDRTLAEDSHWMPAAT